MKSLGMDCNRNRDLSQMLSSLPCSDLVKTWWRYPREAEDLATVRFFNL